MSLDSYLKFPRKPLQIKTCTIIDVNDITIGIAQSPGVMFVLNREIESAQNLQIIRAVRKQQKKTAGKIVFTCYLKDYSFFHPLKEIFLYKITGKTSFVCTHYTGAIDELNKRNSRPFTARLNGPKFPSKTLFNTMVHPPNSTYEERTCDNGITIDFSNNLFFYGSKKLDELPTEIFIRPPIQSFVNQCSGQLIFDTLYMNSESIVQFMKHKFRSAAKGMTVFSPL